LPRQQSGRAEPDAYAPAARVAPDDDVRLVRGLVRRDRVRLTRARGAEAGIVGAIVAWCPGRVERRDAAGAHELEERLGALGVSARARQRSAQRAHLLCARKARRVRTVTLARVLKGRQDERGGAVADRGAEGVRGVGEQRAHGCAPRGAGRKVGVEQQHECGARGEAREVAPRVERARKWREHEVDVRARGERGRCGE
jgi:hypothetical protein